MRENPIPVTLPNKAAIGKRRLPRGAQDLFLLELQRPDLLPGEGIDKAQQQEDQTGGQIAHGVADLVPGLDASGAGNIAFFHVSPSFLPLRVADQKRKRLNHILKLPANRYIQKEITEKYKKSLDSLSEKCGIMKKKERGRRAG